MKKITLLLFFFLNLSLYSQNKSKLFDLEISDLNKKEIILLLEKKTNYTFFYIDDWIDDKRVTNKFKKASIINVLDFLFKDTPINYFITNDYQIILTYRNLIHRSVYETTNLKEFSSTTNKESFKRPIFIKNNQENEKNFIKIGKEKQNQKKQKFTLSGYILNKETKKPIEGAVIMEVNKKKSTTSNYKGFYSLQLPYGKNDIETLLQSHTSFKKKIVIYDNGSLNIILSEKNEELDEITINTSKKNNVKETISGITQLKTEDIKNIPLVLGERDILKVATTLPGISSAGEGSEGVNVRGGKVDQNLFLLDDGVLYNPTHFLGFFSAINPFTTKDLKIYKGNIPAEYGGRISSVFDMKSKDASSTKFKGEASIGPITGNLAIEIPVFKNKSGLLLAIRTTYSDWILKSLNNRKLNKSSASFIDIMGKYNHNFNKNNSLKITTYYSKDKYQIASDTVNSYGNNITSLNWMHKFNNKNQGNLILTTSNYKFNLDYNSSESAKNFNLNYNIKEVGVKLKMKYKLSKKHKINYGISSKFYNISPGNIIPKSNNSLITPREIANEKALESAIFVSDRFYVNKKLSLNLGLRYTQFLALGKSVQNFYNNNSPKNSATFLNSKEYADNEIIKTYNGLEYRLSARYLLGEDFSLKASYNKSYQYIHRLNNNTTATPIDTWRLSNINISPQEGNQTSLGLFKNIKDYEISLEGYYKQSKNILDYKIGANFLLNDNIETEVLQGPGKSYGVEFLIKKKLGKLNGWLGYSYSKSFLKLNSRFNEEKVNNGNYFPTNYDKPHDFTTVLNYKLTKRYSVSANFIYQTGKPITYPTGKYTYQNSEYLLYSDRNKFRIPDYYRLDIGINIEGNHKIKKFAHSFWNFSIYNVLGRNNPNSVFFNTNSEGKVLGYKSSIFSYPIPTITYNFKF